MRVLPAVLVLGILGCGAEDNVGPPEASGERWELSLEPPFPLEAASPVVSFVVTWHGDSGPPSAPILLEGEPSSVSAGKYSEGETTETLAERIVPTQSEVGAAQLVIRALNVLAVGQRYTVLSREGVIGAVYVDTDNAVGYLMRVWPPRDSNAATVQTIYCGNAAPTQASPLQLFPSRQVARLEPGIDDSDFAKGNCVRIVPQSSSGDMVQPPVRIGDYAVEPSPFRSGVDRVEIPPLVCAATETAFGPGCFGLEHGRGVVRGPAGPTFWVVQSRFGQHVEVVKAGGSFAIPLQEQGNELGLRASVFDLSGRSFFSSLQIAAGPPTARVIINEVMANPLGAEPAEEWVELTNDGTAVAEMIGWKLRDQGGEIEIPPLRLEPSAVLLLVRGDYVGGLAGDVVPPRETALVRVPQLGKGGFLNSGEALSIANDSGVVVSRFPARASEREGVSIARRSPLTLDDDPDGFVSHAYPGASPGTQNATE